MPPGETQSEGESVCEGKTENTVSKVAESHSSDLLRPFLMLPGIQFTTKK